VTEGTIRALATTSTKDDLGHKARKILSHKKAQKAQNEFIERETFNKNVMCLLCLFVAKKFLVLFVAKILIVALRLRLLAHFSH
jgi:hypothetical protein